METADTELYSELTVGSGVSTPCASIGNFLAESTGEAENTVARTASPGTNPTAGGGTRPTDAGGSSGESSEGSSGDGEGASGASDSPAPGEGDSSVAASGHVVAVSVFSTIDQGSRD